MELNDIRPELKAFVINMEKVLRENDHKGGWEKEDYNYLRKCLEEELYELDSADGSVEVSKEVTDIANFCMMIWSNIHKE